MFAQVDGALRLAARLHSGQSRDGEAPLPYLVHPVEVLVNLRHVGGVVDEEVLVAGVLHDVIEQSAYPPEKIGREFGARVRGLVVEMTRREPSQEETRALTKEEVWQLRAAMLLEEIARMSPDAQRIKLADRLSNLDEALRTKVGDKLARYLGHTFLILETISRDVNPPLWDAVRDGLARAR